MSTEKKFLQNMATAFGRSDPLDIPPFAYDIEEIGEVYRTEGKTTVHNLSDDEINSLMAFFYDEADDKTKEYCAAVSTKESKWCYTEFPALFENQQFISRMRDYVVIRDQKLREADLVSAYTYLYTLYHDELEPINLTRWELPTEYPLNYWLVVADDGFNNATLGPLRLSPLSRDFTEIKMIPRAEKHNYFQVTAVNGSKFTIESAAGTISQLVKEIESIATKWFYSLRNHYREVNFSTIEQC